MPDWTVSLLLATPQPLSPGPRTLLSYPARGSVFSPTGAYSSPPWPWETRPSTTVWPPTSCWECLPPVKGHNSTSSVSHLTHRQSTTRIYTLTVSGFIQVLSYVPSYSHECESIKLRVLLYGLPISSSSAIPTVTPETVSVSIGQSTTFLCQASGTPAPSLTWYNATSTNQITAGTPRVTLSPSTLTLHDIVREDQGEYVCRATHPNGTTEASAMLFVNGETHSSHGTCTVDHVPRIQKVIGSNFTQDKVFFL